jgi:natural resistance-associated macrophage protein
VALAPLVGRFASLLFAVGLLNAALLSAAILPLATAYNVAEGLGLESGVNKRFSEAPAFYWLYTSLIVVGAGFVLIPGLPLMRVIMVSQVANGILLPFVLFFMLKLVNRPDLMGTYVNTRGANAIAWMRARQCPTSTSASSDRTAPTGTRAHVNRLTNSSAFSATSRQPASIVSACPRPGILTISVAPLLRFCFL